MRSESPLLLCLLLLGCGGSDGSTPNGPDQSDQEVADDEGKADGVSHPWLGSYDPDNPLRAGYAALVLKSDETFWGRLHPTTPNIYDPSKGIVEESGTYAFTKTSSARFMTFRDSSKKVIHKFSYTLSDNQLRLNDTASDLATFKVNRAPSMSCGADGDCGLQGGPTCGGQVTCDPSHHACACADDTPDLVTAVANEYSENDTQNMEQAGSSGLPEMVSLDAQGYTRQYPNSPPTVWTWSAGGAKVFVVQEISADGNGDQDTFAEFFDANGWLIAAGWSTPDGPFVWSN